MWHTYGHLDFLGCCRNQKMLEPDWWQSMLSHSSSFQIERCWFPGRIVSCGIWDVQHVVNHQTSLLGKVNQPCLSDLGLLSQSKSKSKVKRTWSDSILLCHHYDTMIKNHILDCDKDESNSIVSLLLQLCNKMICRWNFISQDLCIVLY